MGRLLKELDAGRKAAVERLRRVAYFHKQAAWLLDHFPEGTLADVPGLVRLVSRAEIEAADWRPTPGRYVGVAPAEVDEDFDYEQTMHNRHAELNDEVVILAATIQKNFEWLGL